MKTMVANFRGPRVSEGKNLRRVLIGIIQRVYSYTLWYYPTLPEKIHRYGLGLSLNSMGIYGSGTQRGL